MKLRLIVRLVVVKKSVDNHPYLLAQQVDAIMSWENRHGTREEHGCDDRALEQHPEWLVAHYIKYGGAKWAEEKLRPRYLRDIEIPVHLYFLEALKVKIRKFKRKYKKEFKNRRRLRRQVKYLLLRILATRPLNGFIVESSKVFS